VVEGVEASGCDLDAAPATPPHPARTVGREFIRTVPQKRQAAVA